MSLSSTLKKAQQAHTRAVSKASNASIESQSSRSPSYSPPPVLSSTKLRATMNPYTNVKDPRLRDGNPRFTDSRKSDDTESQLSSLVAPWNGHLAGTQVSPYVIDSADEDDDSEDSNVEIGPKSSMEDDPCDNCGCNGPHNHDDCPLEKRCTDCHALDHFWTECQMICKDCGSPRHILKYCPNFRAPNAQGIAYPRQTQPQDGSTFTVERKRELETKSHQRIEPLLSSDKRLATSSTSKGKQQKSPTHGAAGYEQPASHSKGRPKIDCYRPPTSIDSYRPHRLSESPRVSQVSDIPTGPKTDRYARPWRVDERSHTKVYCEYWLKTGHYNYEHTHAGCKYEHEVPDQRTLQDLGIHDLPTVVRRQASLQQTFLSSKAPRVPPAHFPREARQKPAMQAETTLVKPEPDPPCSSLKSSATPSEPLPSSSCSTNRNPFPPPLSKENYPASNGGRLGGFKLEKPKVSISTTKEHPTEFIDGATFPNLGTRNSPPMLKEDHRGSTVSGSEGQSQSLKSDKMKAFEEEEFFKQKRHEAEMKRRRDEFELEYQHALRMAEPRKKRKSEEAVRVKS